MPAYLAYTPSVEKPAPYLKPKLATAGLALRQHQRECGLRRAAGRGHADTLRCESLRRDLRPEILEEENFEEVEGEFVRMLEALRAANPDFRYTLEDLMVVKPVHTDRAASWCRHSRVRSMK